MKPLIVALTCAAAFMLSAAAAGQNGVGERFFRLRFPDGVDLSGLEIHYQLTGPFGGVGEFLRTDPAVREYAIVPSYEGQAARTLKAIIYVPRFRFVLLSEPALEDRSQDMTTITLEPLNSIPLSGEIALARPVRGLTIQARYMAYWGHDFFGIVDGAVQTFTVAESKIADDGTFTLNVPDFSRDPVVASYAGRSAAGGFRLIVRESGTGNIPYGLEDVGRRGRPAEVAIASDYPGRVQVVVVSR